MNATIRPTLSRWIIYFTSSLAIVAGIQVLFESRVRNYTSIAPVDLELLGGNGTGNKESVTNDPQCDYGFCHLTGGTMSYKCMDRGQKIQTRVYPGQGDSYVAQTYTFCYPEYRYNNTTCIGAPIVTTANCARSRDYYVDP